MKKYKFVFLGLCLISLTGCYNYREINELAITSAIAIDKVDDKYQATVQVVNTKKNSGDGNNSENIPAITFTSTGNTIQEVLRKMVIESPKRLYASHLEIIIIGEEYAKEGIEDMFDYLFRDAEIRKQFLVVIAKNSKASDILKCLTPLEPISAQNIRSTIETDAEFLGTSKKITFEEVLRDYLNTRKEMVIPTIEIINSEPDKDKLESIKEIDVKTEIKLAGLALFKDDKLVEYLNNEESIYTNIINSNIENTVINYKCDNQNNYLSIEIIDSKTSIENKKNSLKMAISIKGDGNITEINCKDDLEDPKAITKLEKEINNKIEKKIKENLELIVKDYHLDSYGFEEIIYKTNNKYYKKINKKTILDFLEFEIKSDIKLIEKGNTLRGIKHDKQD